VKTFDKKLKPRSSLPTALGASLILAVAAPALAAPAVGPHGLNAPTEPLHVAAMKNPCNPCNPCPAQKKWNPCSAKNPCAAHNPCAAKNPCAAANPCAANPCAANPCAASNKIDPKLVTRPKGTHLATGNPAALLAEGKVLFMSDTLSTNGMSCNTCHDENSAFENTFAKPYPHTVSMAAGRAGMKSINLDEMIQICMVAPMQAKPLAWESRELAALTAYVTEVQKTFVAENPCAAKNPCAAHNPCAAKNPCAAHNPCAAKNPCAAH